MLLLTVIPTVTVDVKTVAKTDGYSVAVGEGGKSDVCMIKVW